MNRKKSGEFNQAEYTRQYRREKLKQVIVYLSKNRDQDIIELLSTVSNKSEFIKALIRREISTGDVQKSIPDQEPHSK